MTGYRFYPTADKAQDDIWDYSVREWGEVRAATYIKGLHEHLQKLADRELRWRDLPVSLVIPGDLQIEAWFCFPKGRFLSPNLSTVKRSDKNNRKHPITARVRRGAPSPLPALQRCIHSGLSSRLEIFSDLRLTELPDQQTHLYNILNYIYT